MKQLNKESKRAGIIGACCATVLCAVAIVLVAEALENNYVYYGLCGLPVIFWLVFCFVYTLKEGIIKFLTYGRLMKVYEYEQEIVDPNNYLRSGLSRAINNVIGAVTLPVICFIPTFVFYLLFAWIFFLVKA